MKTYIVNWYSTVFRLFIFASLLAGSLLAFSDTRSLLVPLIWTGLLILVDLIIFFSTFRLVKVDVNNSKIKLSFRKAVVLKKEKLYLLNDIAISLRDEVGARGSKAEELRFYKDGKKLIGVGRGYDGWTKDKIWTVYMDLKDLGVKDLS